MTKKVRICGIIVFIIILCSITSISVFAKSNELSPALSVIANSTVLRKCGILNQNLYFDRNDFVRTFGDCNPRSITVTSLPSEKDGKLMLEGEEVYSGQTILRRDFDKLYFKPASFEITESGFTFACSDCCCDSSVRCSMYMLSEINTSPVFSLETSKGEKLITQKNIMIYSSLHADDDEEDEIIYEVSKYPEHGTVQFKENGVYTYTPALDYTGGDSFECVCSDIYGNYSKPIKITLSIVKQAKDVFYSDMISNKYHNDAIKAVSYGLLDDMEIDGKMCFLPEKNYTKSDFIVSSMKSLGIDGTLEFLNSDFTDGSDIPVSAKGYIDKAVREGYISGTATDKGTYLYPNYSLTNGEAYKIIEKMLVSKGMENKINSFSYLNESPDEVLTKEKAALLLVRLYEL